jgi:O-antigen/teichoic acid export membrane protein
MNILAVSANHIDKILLFHFLGAVETAIYSIAIAMPGQINSMLKNIKVISRSKFTTRKLTDIEKNFKKRLLMFLAVVIAVIVSYVLASPLVFKLLFPQYLDSIFYSQVFSISLLGSLAFVYTALLEAKKQVRKLYLFNTVSYGTQILLMVVMIPIWGLMGAVLAKVVGQIVSLCFGYLLIKFDESTELDTTEGTI